jgi:hypothetical protein
VLRQRQTRDALDAVGPLLLTRRPAAAQGGTAMCKAGGLLAGGNGWRQDTWRRDNGRASVPGLQLPLRREPARALAQLVQHLASGM